MLSDVIVEDIVGLCIYMYIHVHVHTKRQWCIIHCCGMYDLYEYCLPTNWDNVVILLMT